MSAYVPKIPRMPRPMTSNWEPEPKLREQFYDRLGPDKFFEAVAEFRDHAISRRMERAYWGHTFTKWLREQGYV